VCNGTNKNNLMGRPEQRCHSSQVRALDAEEKVWEWVESRLKSPSLMMDLARSIDDTQANQRQRDEADYRALMEVLTELEEEEDMLIDLYTHKGITLPKFQERKTHIDDRKQGVDSSLKEIEARMAKVEEAKAELEAIEEWAELLREGIDQFGFEEKQRTLEAFCVRGRVNSDGTLTMRGLFTDEAFTIVLAQQRRLQGGPHSTLRKEGFRPISHCAHCTGGVL
jgi:hypothetical protein